MFKWASSVMSDITGVDRQMWDFTAELAVVGLVRLNQRCSGKILDSRQRAYVKLTLLWDASCI